MQRMYKEEDELKLCAQTKGLVISIKRRVLQLGAGSGRGEKRIEDIIAAKGTLILKRASGGGADL